MLETNVVTLVDPFHWTEEDVLKFVPVSVSVKPLLPKVVDVGEMEARVGIGLFIVSVCAPEVPPPGPGFTTVTESVPPTVMLLEEMVTDMVVLEMKVVVSGEPFT